MQIRMFKTLVPLDGQRLLLAVTAFALMGIVVGYRFPSVGLAVCGAGAAVCLGWLAFRRRVLMAGRVGVADAAAVAFALVLFGAGRVAWNAGRLAHEAETLKALETTQAFECRIKSASGAWPLAGIGMRYAFDVENVTWFDGTNTFRIRTLPVSVSWFGTTFDRASAPKPGETWRMTGRVQVLTRTNGLEHAYISTNRGEGRSLRLTSAKDLWQGRLASVQQEAARRVSLDIMDWSMIPALNQALMLGCRNEIPDDMRYVFAASGTIHVFAVSGLHIGLVAGVFIFFVQMTGLSRHRWALVLIPLIIAYTLVSGARPSAARACCAAVCLFLAPLLGRKASGASALLMTALLFHLWQPSLVFNLGSVFSFGVMAGLILFVSPLMTLMRKWLGYLALQKKIELLEATGDNARWTRFTSVVVRYVADVFAVSVAAWLASVPLTGYYFGRVAIGGLFANPVVTSCAFLVITAGFLGLLAGLFSTWVAICFNHAAGFFTMVMVKTAEATSAIKVLSPETGPWPAWVALLWFAALIAVAVWMNRRQPAASGLDWLDGGGRT